MSNIKVQMIDVDKSYHGVQVLKKVNFELRLGEVHALVGENGAGKSTLMKILTGVEKKDNGKIVIDNKEVDVKNINIANDLNIAFLHQELISLRNMTIWENMFLGREIKTRLGFLNIKKMKKVAQEKLANIGLNIEVDTLIKNISIGKQQLVEIASALLWNKEIIILDEPTSALTDLEISTFFDTIKKLQKENVSFVYITHRLEEIFEIADRITVLRDGNYIGTIKVSDILVDDIIKMMVGYEISERYPRVNKDLGNIVLQVRNLSKVGMYNNITFELREGEILGFSGLMGSGRTEIMQTIFGIHKADHGEIYVNGKKVKIKSPIMAKKNGIAYITENRKEEGVILDFSISDNLVIPNLKLILNKCKFINAKKQQDISNKYVEKLEIKTENIEKIVKNLSGGNQQKVVVGKWLATSPIILILDEPTRGVDVGAKYEIYEIINELKKNNVAIIMISSELPEIIGMSDRIAVMYEGNLKQILNRDEFDQEKIMKLATGGE